MRSPVEAGTRLFVLGLSAALASCGLTGGGESAAALVSDPAASSAEAGPAGDYPLVVGEPFTIGGELYTPADTLNYDTVGYTAVDGGAGVSAAHRTLPLPSYAEVTSLDSGKTILVRVERRGPMSGPHLLALSSAAAAQLGVADGAPVRLRRVNPPEAERAELRAGRPAPERIETPKSLVEVLRRKLPSTNIASLRPDAATYVATAPTTTISPAVTADPLRAPAVASAPRAFVIQAGTFASRANADRAAKALGGFLMPAGKLFRVRSGPFGTRAEADAALAKVRAAGYSDARVTIAG